MLLLTYIDPRKQNYYERLGLTPDATRREIELAYRRLSRTAHPDSGGSVETWLWLQEAYDALCDPDQRFVYDTLDMSPQELRESVSVLLDGLLLGYENNLMGQREMRMFLKQGMQMQIEAQEQQIDKVESDIRKAYRVIEDVDPTTFLMQQLVAATQARIASLGTTLARMQRVVAQFERAKRLIPHLHMLLKDRPPPPPPVVYQAVIISNSSFHGGFTNSTGGW